MMGYAGLLLLACCCAITGVTAEEFAPKSPSEHKINFGWPKFFNPEMGMMREKSAKKGTADKEYEGNELDTSHEDDEYESLIDYTLKGGLRGTLLLLNSTSVEDMGNITSSEMGDLKKAAEKAMEDDEEEADAEGKMGGEVTEEGVRLRLPLVTKKHPAELGKYGAKITFYTGEEPTKFIYYGNWCGRGGRSAPVDDLDRCCLEHARCYGRTVRQCPDVWKKPYNQMYAWTVLKEEVMCVRSEAYCVNHVCNCDRQAAVCFQEHLSRSATHLGTKTA
ncbi:uncharacterized protein LOC135106701 [Scylla paramamosain]|uniref:uncharacterized protein LOC135106701 n=1 Tax=Scylla paramamosain TaxID=85552 RepID=UPI003083EB22